MLLRLTPALGGDGTVFGITAMNDTGSTVLTVFDTDLPRLGNVHGYRGWRNRIHVRDATGRLTVFRRIAVQVRLVKSDNSPIGNWIDLLFLCHCYRDMK